MPRVQALVHAAERSDIAMAFNSALDPDHRIPMHSLILAEQGRRLVIGGYYSVATAILAAEVVAPQWLAASVPPDAGR
jgi:hypothetical protein